MQAYAAGNQAYVTTKDSLLRQEPLPELIRMPSPIRAVVANPNGRSLILADERDAVLWTPGAPSPRPWWLHTPSASAAAFSDDGKRLAVIHANGEMKVWDCFSGLLVSSRKLVEGKDWTLEWSPDGKHLAACLANQTIYRVSPDGKDAPVSRTVPKDWAHGPLLMDTASKAAGITREGALGIWDLSAGRWIFPPVPGFANAASVVAVADEKMIGVVFSEENTKARSLRFFSAVGGRAKGSKLQLEEGSDFFLSPHGTYAAIRDKGGFRVSRIADGAVVWSSVDHHAQTIKIYFPTDETRFMTEALDSRHDSPNCQFWELPSGRALGAPVAARQMTDGKFSVDGSLFLARSPGGWEVFDTNIGTRVAVARDDFKLARQLGANPANLVSTTDPTGCWLATRVGNWMAVSPMLPDFFHWSLVEAERLAGLAEGLAGKTSNDRGGLQNTPQGEIITAIDQIAASLEATLAKSPSWSARVAAWQLLDASQKKLSPWLELDVAAWADETLDSKDRHALGVINSLGPLGDAVDQKLKTLSQPARVQDRSTQKLSLPLPSPTRWIRARFRDRASFVNHFRKAH